MTLKQYIRRRVIELRAKGLSLRQIGASMEQEGLFSPGLSRRWDATTVRRIVQRAIADAPARLAELESEAIDLRTILRREGKQAEQAAAL